MAVLPRVNGGVSIGVALSKHMPLLLACCLGVTVDKDVRQGAAIMAGSVLLYGTVQLPASLGFSNSPQVHLAGRQLGLAGAGGGEGGGGGGGGQPATRACGGNGERRAAMMGASLCLSVVYQGYNVELSLSLFACTNVRGLLREAVAAHIAAWYKRS